MNLVLNLANLHLLKQYKVLVLFWQVFFKQMIWNGESLSFSFGAASEP